MDVGGETEICSGAPNRSNETTHDMIHDMSSSGVSNMNNETIVDDVDDNPVDIGGDWLNKNYPGLTKRDPVSEPLVGSNSFNSPDRNNCMPSPNKITDDDNNYAHNSDTTMNLDHNQNEVTSEDSQYPGNNLVHDANTNFASDTAGESIDNDVTYDSSAAGKNLVQNANTNFASNTAGDSTVHDANTNFAHVIPREMEDIIDDIESDSEAPDNPAYVASNYEGRSRTRNKRKLSYRDMIREGMVSHRDKHMKAVNRIGLVEECSLNIKQLSFKRGIEAYGEEGLNAVMKELTQIIDEYEVCIPVQKDKSKVQYLRTHDLLTEKLDGTKKARFVVGKLASWRDVEKIDWGIDCHSPTIDMKVLNTMCSVCIEEDLNLDVWDIRAAFLQADMLTKGIYACIEKHIADLIFDLKPEWKKYKQYDGSLLVELLKAWYGTEAASALWYKTIRESIVGKCEYQQHKYVECMFFKKLESGKTAYILLHVDDIGAMMPSDGKERNRVLAILQAVHGTMKVQEGDEVTYIGVELSRDRTNKRFLVRQTKRIEKLCKQFNIDTPEKCPVRASLMDEDDSELLDKNGITDYRSLVMSMRYIAMTSMPECLFICSFLATVQTRATTKYLNDAYHVLHYMFGRQEHATFIYGIGSTTPIIRVYADASFAIHTGSKSHGGIAIFIGGSRCAVYNASSKISAMVKSSTDAEIMQMEASTYLGDYYKMVLEEIGYHPTITYMQDNEGAVTLVTKECRAFDKKRRWVINAINSIYAHITESDSNVMSCLSELMHGDIHTKPMVGILFEYHRRIIRGDYTLSDALM